MRCFLFVFFFFYICMCTVYVKETGNLSHSTIPSSSIFYTYSHQILYSLKSRAYIRFAFVGVRPTFIWSTRRHKKKQELEEINFSIRFTYLLTNNMVQWKNCKHNNYYKAHVNWKKKIYIWKMLLSGGGPGSAFKNIQRNEIERPWL